EGYGSITSHEENWFVFSRSQRFSAPNNNRNSEIVLYSAVTKHHISEGNTRRLQRESEDDETPQRAFFASEEAHREPAESVVDFRSGKQRRYLFCLKDNNSFDGASNLQSLSLRKRPYNKMQITARISRK